MKNIRLKIFIILLSLLCCSPAFCVYGNGVGSNANSNNVDSKGIIEAIDRLRRTMVDSLSGSGSSSIVNALNKIFVTDNSKKPPEQSIIGKSVDMYAKEFYSLYSNKDYINNTMEINNLSEVSHNNNSTASNGDLMNIENKVKGGIKGLVDQEIYYITQRNVSDKLKDMFALVAIKAEAGDNNIDPNANMSDGMTVKAHAKDGFEDGSLDIGNKVSKSGDKDKKKDKDKEIKDIMDVNVLIGSDSYFGEVADNVKVFINQLIQAIPSPKTFSFPGKIGSEKTTTVYMPYADTEAGTQYTSISIPTTPAKTCTCPKEKGTCTCDSEYKLMLNMLSANSLYQEYKIKFRAKMALHTLYLSNIFRIFQERYKEKDKDKSLVEKEREMASVGLTKTYYNDLRDKSAADVNLEMLHTMNKVVYFLYKLHQDNERNLLLISATESLSQTMDIQDEGKYFRPIGNLIKNRCWDESDFAPKNSTPTERQQKCLNPAAT